MSARRIADLQSHCPIPVYSLMNPKNVYGHICNFRVRDDRLVFVLRMVNDRETDIDLDPVDTEYVQNLTSEFRARNFRVNLRKVFFRVGDRPVALTQFFCEAPFTKDYFAKCVSSNEVDCCVVDDAQPMSLDTDQGNGDAERSNCAAEQGDGDIQCHDAEQGEQGNNSEERHGDEQGPGEEQGHGYEQDPGEEQDPGGGQSQDHCVVDQHRTVGQPDRGDENLPDIGSMHCEDRKFKEMVIDNAMKLITERNKCIKGEEMRKRAIVSEIQHTQSIDHRKTMSDFMIKNFCPPPQPEYLRHKPDDNQGSWEDLSPVQVAALQKIVNRSCEFELILKRARRFFSQPIEDAYVNLCQSLLPSKVVFEPNLQRCGEPNQFLMWRSYCPTEECMRHMAWNQDKVVDALQRTVRKVYLASRTLTYGDKWCNLRRHATSAFMVRVCVENCTKVGNEYVIDDPHMMIPAYHIFW